jgi:hypothetical protein
MRSDPLLTSLLPDRPIENLGIDRALKDKRGEMARPFVFRSETAF